MQPSVTAKMTTHFANHTHPINYFHGTSAIYGECIFGDSTRVRMGRWAPYCMQAGGPLARGCHGESPQRPAAQTCLGDHGQQLEILSTCGCLPGYQQLNQPR